MTLLATHPPHQQRMALLCYALDQFAPTDHRWGLLAACLRDEAWHPCTDAGPVAWDTVEAWFVGVNATTRRYIEQYRGTPRTRKEAADGSDRDR